MPLTSASRGCLYLIDRKCSSRSEFGDSAPSVIFSTRHLELPKCVSPVSWRHVNFYGEYTFREAEAALDIRQIVDQVEATRDAEVGGTN